MAACLSIDRIGFSEGHFFGSVLLSGECENLTIDIGKLEAEEVNVVGSELRLLHYLEDLRGSIFPCNGQ
jgi:hypothetical protein